MEISAATGPTDEVRLLVHELNQELGALYTPNQCHGLALDAIFQSHIRFFVARQSGRAVGCGGVALFADFAEVKRMYVRLEARRQGVADAIMARLIAETRAAGLSVLRLETGTHSSAAIRFYRKSGFRDCMAFEPYASLPPHRISASAFLERAVS
ncbi:MAG TPA: GNAT family N-acetyltransferase [Rhizomicrobium sp.]|jgi:putative acetyltransferase|nr:GNAT family N-acetyltransferase [Rhizomicrobium sp.]